MSNFLGTATLMNHTKQEIFQEKHRLQIQEISNLIEKARLERGQAVSVSNDLLENAYELADKIGYLAGKGHSLRELSVNFLHTRLYKNAVKTLEQASQFFVQAGEQSIYRKCLNELSDIYFTLGDYELCLESLYQSLKVSVQLKEPALIAEIYNQVGSVYKVIGEFQKAIEQHQLALNIFEKVGDLSQVSATNYYIGNCYNWADELDVAYNYLEKSLKSAQALRDQSLKISPLGSLAILYTKSKNFVKAEEYFFMAIDAVDHIHNRKLKADLLKSLGNLYLEQKLFIKAISTLQEALMIVEKLEVKTPTNQIHFYLSASYEGTGDFKQALVHFKKFSEITREITNEEIAIKTKGVQLKFDLEEIKKQKELAEHGSRLKDRLLSSISHELRTPLNGVLGMANLLADTHPSPEQLDYINTIKLSANNLINIIDDILDYSKIKSGEIQLSHIPFNLPELIKGLAQSVKVKANQKQIDFLLVFAPGIPSLVVADKNRLSQVLNNLLSNAIKYTDKGTVTLEVKSNPISASEATFIFKVTDTGIGISEDRLPGLFEIFARESGEQQKITEGTGLGLAIVKQLVDLLKGEVRVSSRLQEGTIFEVELVLPFEEKSADQGNSNKAVALRDLSEISILLVEDNKVNQFLGKQILNKLGFRVQIAGNGREAVEVINKNNFDLILMDLNMPVMNGYDLTQLIRNQLPAPKNATPIIALTAYASANEKEKAHSMGMNDFITKPYSPDDLLRVITKQLNLKIPVIVQNENAGSQHTELAQEIVSLGLINHLRQLMNGNEQDLKRMLEMYIVQIPAINLEIKKAILEKDWNEVYQQAHKLKSSVKVLNISRMSELITMIEEYARSGENTELLGALLEAFKKECSVAVHIMQEALA